MKLPMHLLANALLLCFTVTAAGQDVSPTLPSDSAEVVVRALPANALDAYLNDPAYDYREFEEADFRIWDPLIEWLNRLFGDRPFGMAKELFWAIIRYSLLGIALAFAIYYFSGMRVRGLFSRRQQSAARAVFFEEEALHTINFKERVDAAMAEGALATAIRYYYLWALHELDASGRIQWRPEKTNQVYAAELPANMRPAFERLTYLFEYVWYGNFPVADATLAGMKQAFSDLTVHLAPEEAYA